MIDKALTLKMIKNKFMTLFVSVAIGLGISLLLWVFSLSGGNVLFLSGSFHMSAQLLVLGTTVAVSLFVYLWIQAYMDYYDHFPMAMATGKTRRQFLWSMLLSSLLVTSVGVLVILVLMNLQVYISRDIWKPLLAEVMPKEITLSWYQVNLMIWYVYLALALALTLLASLNYRFGAKIWLYLAALFFIQTMLGHYLFEKSEAGVWIVPNFGLRYWFSRLLGERWGEWIANILQLLIEMGVIIALTLRLDQVDKEKLS